MKTGGTPEEKKGAAIGGGIGWTRRAVLGAVCAAVIGVYAWSAHPGFVESLGSGAEDHYYNLLVRGFREGQLNVKLEAPPGLARTGGTTDGRIERNRSGDPGLDTDRLVDLSYYKGKLYLFFGATPALVLFWPYAAVTGHYLAHKDAVVIFFSVGFLAGAGLLCAVWRRCFKETSFGLLVCGTLALGLANLAPAILGRSDVYVVAISCGYALTMLALAGVWGALEDAGRRWLWLAAASLAYGLALGARPGLLFGAVILLVPVAKAWQERRSVWRLLPAAGGPVVLMGLGILVYNAMRFDHALEFGQRYQLPITAHHQFSPSYLWFNFRVGFLEAANWTRGVPFVYDMNLPAQPSRYFGVDHPFGVLTNIPVVWLALAAPLAWRGRSGEERSLLRWFSGAVALLFGTCALTLCLHDSMCLRYELEYASPLVLLAVIGLLGLERTLAGQPVWRQAARCGWGLLLVFSAAFNLLANFNLQADVHLGSGIMFLKSGKAEEAIAQYQTALQLDPGYAEAHYDLGNALRQKGGLDLAITQYHAALQIKPDYTEAHNNLGNALLAKGDLEEAIAEYRKASQTDPGNAQFHLNLGLALSASGDVNGAIAQYRDVLAIQPNFAAVRDNLGSALLLKGDVDGAIACFKETAAMNPDQEEAWYNLGNALLQKGDLDPAIASFRKALQIAPRSAEACGNLGVALFQKGETREAMDSWQKALEIQPDQVNALVNFAWSLATTPDATLRDGAKAVALAGRASQLSGGGNPAILRILAAAYAEEGNYERAAGTARRAAELAAGQKNQTLAATLQQEIKLYEAGKPALGARP
ncbi:MAG: tetratricopeptide repeat protein [Verrucomicrobiota bacterium]